MAGISTIGNPSAAATDLGLGLQQQTAAEIEAVKKKRAQQVQRQNLLGMSSQPNAAYMSLTGNQF